MKFKRTAGALLAALWAFGPGAPAVRGEARRRVVSINVCTDQLVLALADPGQVAAVSRLARHPEMSFLAEPARTVPVVRGAAEEVLRLGPDLVLAGAFASTATRERLAAHGLRVEAFAPPQSIADARAEIARAAALLGHPARGAALLAALDRALAAAAAEGASPPLTALALERRGYASGRDTLLSDVMARAGLANAAARLGIVSIDRAPLEAILKARPTLLVLEDVGNRPADQGSALLLHPALAHAVPPSRRIAIPVAELTCGGPALAALAARLGREVARIRAGIGAELAQ